MVIETHPYNDRYGIPSIKENTTKLILGTFPAYQVTSKDNPRLDFYYGSDDNKFWELLFEVYALKFKLTSENILTYFSQEGIGILDIIRKCYRKNGKSSSDDDLAVLEYQDIISVLSNSKIDTIYCTSSFVKKLLIKQIEPLLNRMKIDGKGKLKKKEIFIHFELGDSKILYVNLSEKIFNFQRRLYIKTLYSPSDQGIRGIAKGLKNNGITISPIEYRILQYKTLLL